MQARDAAKRSPFLAAVRFNEPSHLDILSFATADDVIPKLYYSGVVDGLFAEWTRSQQRGWVPSSYKVPWLDGNVDISKGWEPLNLASLAPLVELIPRLEHIKESLHYVSLANVYSIFEVRRDEHPRAVIQRLHDEVIRKVHRFRLLKPRTSDREARLKFFSEPLSAPIGWINVGDTTQYTYAGLAHKFTTWSLKERAQDFNKSSSAASLSLIIHTLRSLSLPGPTDWKMQWTTDDYYGSEMLIELFVPTHVPENRYPASMIFPLGKSKIISQHLPVMNEVIRRLAFGTARSASFTFPRDPNSDQPRPTCWSLSPPKIGDACTRLFMDGSEEQSTSYYW